MSSTPSPAQRRPLHERSASQTNSLAAIRIVPYSPPRPLSIISNDVHDRPSSIDPQDAAAPGRAVGTGASVPIDLYQGLEEDPEGDSKGKIAPRQPHYAGDASWPSTQLVAAKCHRVSGSSIPSHLNAPGSSVQTTLVPDRPGAASPTPTKAQDISQLHASSHHEEDLKAAAASSRRPPSRRRNFITVYTGRGTFALQPQSAPLQGQGTFNSPSLSLSLSTQSSFERLSDLFSSDGRPSTPLSTLPERTPSPCISLDSPSTRLVGDHIVGSSSSPWNYRLVGGLRKVPVTPDPKQNRASPPAATLPSTADTQPPPTPHDTVSAVTPDDLRSLLNTKASFQSSQSASTASEKTNYKVYGASSPTAANPVPDTDSLLPPSSSDSNTNYQIIGRSSPAPSPSLSPSRTAGSDANYVLLGDPSPHGPASALIELRSEYSQESLLVPPLQPIKRKLSFERIGPYKSRSRESFRSGSLSSINSIIGQEAIQAFLSTPLTLRRPSCQSGFVGLGADPWSSNSVKSITYKPPMQAHPHLWSSQLSTVPSESEGGSEPVSRSVSPLSSSGRRSSGYHGNHSRQMLSISSSLAAYDEYSSSQPQSLTESLDRPQPTLTRGATVRLVQDQDEHGDGLAELRDIHHPLHQRPSRRRLASLLSSNTSDRNLHSSGSSRSNSLNSGSIPTWARLYYGSGERRWLRHAASSESMVTDYNDGGSRPTSSFRTGSPSAEHMPLSIYSPRRRPREIQPPPVARPASDSGSLDINPVPLQGIQLRSALRKQTSSIWSPHLARDQRASGYSIWEPPSVDWSTESGPLGRRNVQVVLFIVGFIFPLAWMVGSFLPLPPKPQVEMAEQPSEGLVDDPHALSPRAIFADGKGYHNARWWRNLNRLMAVVGLLMIAAIVALIVVGIRQGWGT